MALYDPSGKFIGVSAPSTAAPKSLYSSSGQFQGASPAPSPTQPAAETPSQPVSPLMASTNELKDLTIGAAKSVGQTVVGAANVGAKVGNLISKIPGLGYVATKPENMPEAQAGDAFTPKNTDQSIGNIAGNIAQFFAPGPAEAEAGKAVDKLVDAGKFAEQFGPKAGDALTGILKVLGHGTVTGASTAAITAAQTGGDKDATLTAGGVGALGGALSKTAELLGPSIQQSLQKSALKLTPTKQTELGTKLNDITDWISQKIGPGTPKGQYAKASSAVNDYENTLQSFLTKDAADKTVSRSNLITQLQDLKGNFNSERDSLAIDKQIDGMITTLKTKWAENIPVAKLNQLKRSTYQNAYNKAGTKVLDWVEAYIGGIYKTSIEGATDGMTLNGQSIGQFNQEYGNALKAKSLLKLAQNKNQLGLSGKALLLLLGSPGGIAGEAAGLILGGSSGITGALKTGIGAAANSGSSIPTTASKLAIPVINQIIRKK